MIDVLPVDSPNKKHSRHVKRKRACTFDSPATNSFTEAEMNEDIPLIDFSSFYHESTRNDVESLKCDALIDPDGTSIIGQFPEILNLFNTLDLDSLFNSPPEPIKRFQNTIHRILSVTILQQMLNLWPPVLPTSTREATALIFFLIKIINNSTQPMNVVHWCSKIIVEKDWYGRSSQENSILKGICLCRRKRKVLRENRDFWAELDHANQFTLYLIQNSKLNIITQCECKSIVLKRKGTIISINNSEGESVKKIIPIDPIQCELWEKINTSTPPSFPLMLTTIERPLPDTLIPAFYEALISDDLLVLRALLHYKVTKITNGTALTEALLDVFAHAGKVNELLLAFIGTEFASPSLTINLILRSNSQLTNLFKVYFKRYGTNYYDNFLKKIIKYVDKAGDLSIKNPINAPESRVKAVLFTTLKHIIRSGVDISPQMRHIASILKAGISLRFNSKQAVYNALSGYFCLRYIGSALTDPKKIDPDIELEHDPSLVLIPFSSLLMNIFNLLPLAGRFEAFNIWNQRLKKHMFPKIVDFVISIAELEQIPVYDPPSPERLHEALDIILNELTSAHGAFNEEYNNLLRNPKGETLLGLNFGTFLQSFFKENVITE
ncbi:GTPase-activator protein [Tritrichomonas foetus]|uniref:GTPase-activator protein n=1 Tax=Tritrichomonas foetus TaxID=1144522 RepID=A0A1J4KMY1_9EUKA|nr:GTPase-activator protein [Tritrichomonas foetus]|eukprot:OHT12256.1 GTPase-activator protein [Tritrichomonas foetus]